MVDWTWDVVTEIARRLTIDANGYTALDEEFDPEPSCRLAMSRSGKVSPPSVHSTVRPSYYYTGEAQGRIRGLPFLKNGSKHGVGTMTVCMAINRLSLLVRWQVLQSLATATRLTPAKQRWA